MTFEVIFHLMKNLRLDNFDILEKFIKIMKQKKYFGEKGDVTINDHMKLKSWHYAKTYRQSFIVRCRRTIYLTNHN